MLLNNNVRDSEREQGQALVRTGTPQTRGSLPGHPKLAPVPGPGATLCPADSPRTAQSQGMPQHPKTGDRSPVVIKRCE